MSITWHRVARIPFTHAGCGIQSVVCLGSGRMLATLEETGAPSPPGFNVARVFRSADNGQTWTELAALASDENLPRGRARSLSLDRVMQSMTGPQNVGAYEAGASVIALTTDAGDTWASSVTNAEYILENYGADGYTVLDFIPTDYGTQYALGQFGAGGKSYAISTDNGVTFTNASTFSGTGTFGVFGGAYLGASTLIAGDTAVTPIRIFRSTNQAASWTPVNVGAGGQQGTVNGAALAGALGSGKALLAATRSTPSLAPKAYFSSDAGATWTEATIGGSANGATDVIAPSTTLAVLGLDVSSAQMGAGGSPFRLSTDGGQTYSDLGTMADTFFAGVGYRVKQFAIADDGAVLAVVQTTDLTNTAPNEIWRGIIDGFSGPGPCAPFGPPPVPVAIMGTRLDCVPIFSPVSCLVDCPADPTPAVGLVVPHVPFTQGFGSIVAILDLEEDLGGGVIAGAALGLRAGCGATFANNLCAVAGC